MHDAEGGVGQRMPRRMGPGEPVEGAGDAPHGDGRRDALALTGDTGRELPEVDPLDELGGEVVAAAGPPRVDGAADARVPEQQAEAGLAQPRP